MPDPTHKPAAFTLVEVLTVLAIIMVLMSIVIWFVSGSQRTVKLKSARAEILVLQSALERYREIYGRWPDRTLPDPKGPLKNYEVVRLLRNWRVDVPLSDPAGRDKTFARDPMVDKLDARQLDAAGNWRDPWGSAYAIGVLPDNVWRVYQRIAQSKKAGTPYTPDADEAAAIAPYGADERHALYWVNAVKSQVNIYSYGPDKICDWGYSFGDGSGYTRGAWDYHASGDKDATPVGERGDDVRP